MAAIKLTSQDKKDFEKFTKYLVYKCIQIIVQSRLGDRVKTQSRPFSTGSDWFNLAVKDLPEVLTECKKVVSSGTLAAGHKVCLEISLKTLEGETMILETWWLDATDQSDPTARISYTVYNRMSILLKSLFCTTRATPAYRLSRKQGPDTYVVCYRIYNTEPEVLCLGEAYKVSKVGSVPSPLGTVTLNVAYRTKMLISPHTSLRDFAADLKDDHFKSEGSPKRSIDIPKPCYTVNRDNRYSAPCEDGYIFGESEYCATSFSTSPVDGFYLGQSPPDRLLVRKASSDTMVKHSPSSDSSPHKVFSDTGRPQSQNMDRIDELHSNGINGIHRLDPNDSSPGQPSKSEVSSENIRQIGAFVSDGESDSDDVDGKTNGNHNGGSSRNKMNSDSGELPLVKIVCEMSSMDNNANTRQNSPPSAVINATDITNTATTNGGVNPPNCLLNGGVNNHHHQNNNRCLNNLQKDNNNEFTGSSNKPHTLQNGITSTQTTRQGSSVDGDGLGGGGVIDNLSPKKRGNLSELSERLRRISGESNRSTGSSHMSNNDEYVMVDVKNALTELDDNPELGQFYRECKLPPDLAMFNGGDDTQPLSEDSASVQDMYNSITDQLQQFEIQAQDFDDFVNSLSVGEST